MTEEIFRHDGYMFNFEATVLSIEGDEIVLDSTAFYPGGGGQVCDIGRIGNCVVTEAYYKGEDIVHRCPKNDLKVGDKIWCEVDWDRRYDLMKGHTGEHLLFCSLKRQDEELSIVKIFISPENKYVIVNKDLSWEQIRAAEAFANQAIRDNLPVTKSIMDRDDPELEKVRIKLDRIAEGEEITVVAIGDIDLSACSGVHVMETSELEMLKITKKASAGKDGFEIHFEIGDKAKDASIDYADLAMEIVDCIGCKPSDAPKAVMNMKAELESNRRILKETTKQILSNLSPVAEAGGVPIYSCKLFGADRNALNDAAESIRSKGGVAAFVSVGDTVSVMLASGSPDVDCKKIFNDVLPMFGGRGGGKPGFAQGGISDKDRADEALKALTEAAIQTLN